MPDDRRAVEEVEARGERRRPELHDQEQQREDHADERDKARPDGEQHLCGLRLGHREPHGDQRQQQS
jgi:hypothetical protein